jgi:hypothetical protein
MKKKLLVLMLCFAIAIAFCACKKKETQPLPQTPGPMMPGQMPSGQMPSGQMPPAQMPPAQMPSGQIPPAQMPPMGQRQGLPPGMMAMGKTQVVVPESVKGKWSEAKIIVEDKTSNTKHEYRVKLNSDFKIPNSNLKIHVGDFLPDFRIDGLNLTSGSNEPRNPALGIRVFENNKQIFPAPGKDWGWLFAKVPSIHPFEHRRYSIFLEEGVKKG